MMASWITAHWMFPLQCEILEVSSSSTSPFLRSVCCNVWRLECLFSRSRKQEFGGRAEQSWVGEPEELDHSHSNRLHGGRPPREPPAWRTKASEWILTLSAAAAAPLFLPVQCTTTSFCGFTGVFSMTLWSHSATAASRLLSASCS